MSFHNLFKRKAKVDFSKRSRTIQSLIGKTVRYLRSRIPDDQNAQIRPAMLAVAIGENELIALTALDMLRRAGVATAHMGLYCKATLHPIGEGTPGDVLPESLPCDACGKEHDLDSGAMQKELFFTLNPGALAKVQGVV